jgi:hypothetical protein
MVEYQVRANERESSSFYDTAPPLDDDAGSTEDPAPNVDGIEEAVETMIANEALENRIILARKANDSETESEDNENFFDNAYKEAQNRLLPSKIEVAYARWNRLYDRGNHFELQQHLMAELGSNKNN